MKNINLSKALICSAKFKSEHCLTNCFHGVPHMPERERDANCRIPEICMLSNSKGIIKIQCKKLSAKQRKEFTDESKKS